jgi:carbon starvation protein CstA
MANIFTAHSSAVGETYAEHCLFAFQFGARMTLGGLAAMVHAVFPFLFVTTASRALDGLNALRARGARPPLVPDC